MPLPCPWCNNPDTVIAKDGGSTCCFKCDPQGKRYHKCRRITNCELAPDGTSYAVDCAGPSMCIFCNPSRRRRCHCPWCEGPICDKTDDDNSVCLRCPGGRLFHECCSLNPQGILVNDVVYSVGGPGRDNCQYCIQHFREYMDALTPK